MGVEREGRGTHEISVGLVAAPGVARQVVLSEPDRTWQTLPIEHAENVETFLVETGDLRGASANVSPMDERGTHMMKLAEESQVDAERGQQTGFELVSVHPVAQSWIAPKLWPISCLCERISLRLHTKEQEHSRNDLPLAPRNRRDSRPTRTLLSTALRIHLAQLSKPRDADLAPTRAVRQQVPQARTVCSTLRPAPRRENA